MRLRSDGTLDYRPMPMPPSAKPWNDMTHEERRQQLIDELLHYHPMMTPEEAEKFIDAVF
jgi:hypothetical protein